MKTNLIVFFLTGLAAVAGAADSARIVTDAKPTVYWQAIRANTVALPVEVPGWATSAVLTVADLAGKTLVNETFTASGEYAWTVFTGSVPEKDGFYELKLEIKNGTKLVQTKTATLALVRNAFEPTVMTSKEVPGWGEAGDVLVLPYSDRWGAGGTLTATLAGVSGDPETVEGLEGDGWFARQLAKTDWRRGAVALGLTNEAADSWAATVERVANGMMIIVW